VFLDKCEHALTMLFCSCWRLRDRPDRRKCEQCRQRLKREAFEAYGGARCVYCGEAELAALNLEHRFDDGYLDKRRGLSGQRLYRHLRDSGYPQGRFDVACANCNTIKKIRGVAYLNKVKAARPPR